MAKVARQLVVGMTKLTGDIPTGRGLPLSRNLWVKSIGGLSWIDGVFEKFCQTLFVVHSLFPIVHAIIH